MQNQKNTRGFLKYPYFRLNLKILFIIAACFFHDSFIVSVDFPQCFRGLFFRSPKILSASFDDRVDLLESLLRDCNGSSDLNYALLARMMSGLDNEEIVICVKAALDQSQKDFKPITLGHITAILHDRDYGLIDEKVDENKDWLRYRKEWTAFHEAGHAVIGACYDRSKVISAASIESRKKCLGFVASHDMYENDKEFGSDSKIKQIEESTLGALAGAISERSFGFDCSSEFKKEYCREKWGEQAEEKLAIINRHNPRLAEIFMNPGAEQDMQHALSNAYHIMSLQSGGDVLKLNADEKFEEQVKILSNLHDQTEDLVKQNKDKITKVAGLLLDHEIVPGKIIYDVCGQNQPEYDFEKVDLKFKLKT